MKEKRKSEEKLGVCCLYLHPACPYCFLTRSKLLSSLQLATYNHKLSNGWILYEISYIKYQTLSESQWKLTLLLIFYSIFYPIYFKIIHFSDCVKSVNRSLYGSIIIEPAILHEQSFSLKHKFSSQ